MFDLQSDFVDMQMIWYMQCFDYVQCMIECLQKYLYYIVEEFEVCYMLIEFVLLLFIEFVYNLQVLLVVKVVGMWQFMFGIGCMYNLKCNMWQDEWCDVFVLMSVVFDYLFCLYDMFGDWYLVLVVYNWGEGNVQCVIVCNQVVGLLIDYQSLWMLNEMCNYVLKLQVVKNIIVSLQQYGLMLLDILNYLYFVMVMMLCDIDVVVVVKFVNLLFDEFCLLNLLFLKFVIFGVIELQILLLFDNVFVFEKNLKVYSGQLLLWIIYMVSECVCLVVIVEKIGVDVDMLMLVNKILVGMCLKLGLMIVVLCGDDDDEDISVDVVENGVFVMEFDVFDMCKMLICV